MLSTSVVLSNLEYLKAIFPYILVSEMVSPAMNAFYINYVLYENRQMIILLCLVFILFSTLNGNKFPRTCKLDFCQKMGEMLLES